MPDFAASLIDRASWAVIGHFALIWMGALACIVVGGSLWAMLRERPFETGSATFGDRDASLGRMTRSDWLVLGTFVAFLASYVFLIFYREDFADYDNSNYT